MSDDDDYSPVDASDSNTDHRSESADPIDSNQSLVQSPTRETSLEATSALIRRSTRNIKKTPQIY